MPRTLRFKANTSTLILLGCFVSGSVAGAQVGGTANDFRLRLEPLSFESSSGEVVAAERGTITVPANRSRPESGTIELAFVRFPSTAEKPASPIVYLAGGPGGSGIGAARGSRFPLFLALREVADVIAFDQRGTGTSKPFNLCTNQVALPLDQPTDPEKAIADLRDQVVKCAERLRGNGVDLAGLTTEESADDLDALRQALGADKISLWGISYGTHLALSTMRRHRAHVDKAILAGIEGPDHTLKPPKQQQELLERIATLAREDRGVGPKVPDLMATIERVLDRLEKQPAEARLVDPRRGEMQRVVAGAWDLKFATAQMLRGPESFAGLPDLYWRLDQGDDLALALMKVSNSRLPVGRAMSGVMDCASSASKARLERIEREARTTLLGDVINLPLLDVCPAWGVRPLDDEFRSDLETDVPTLFISGTLDGRTPPENAEEVRAGFSHSVHLVIDGAGHSDPLFLSSPEILDVMLAFLHDRPIPTTSIRLDPPRFVEPRRPLELEPRALERYVGTFRIGDREVRRVILAGNQLFTQRGTGQPLPIRPYEQHRFFYEGTASLVEFHLGEDGRVTAMTVFQNGGSGRAEKVD